jgi:polyisoprenoid-binding protein YceI
MASSKWNIDAAHSSLQFSVRHMVITKVRGAFKSYTGSVELKDDKDLELANVEVVIDASSIDTAEAKRDEHLRGADFLDVATYPTLRFQSRSIERKGQRYQVQGDLTLHGVTRPVVLDVEFQGQGKDPWGGQRAAFSAKTSLNREEFGLSWNQVLEAGGLLVGTKIDIEIELQAVKVVQTEAAVSAGAAA